MASNKASFSWEDPYLSAQLTDDERQVQEAARAYCQEKLLPRADGLPQRKPPDHIFREIRKRACWGPTIPEQYGAPAQNYVYGLVARARSSAWIPATAA